MGKIVNLFDLLGDNFVRYSICCYFGYKIYVFILLECFIGVGCLFGIIGDIVEIGFCGF